MLLEDHANAKRHWHAGWAQVPGITLLEPETDIWSFRYLQACA